MKQLICAVGLGIALLAPMVWAETHVPAGPVSGEWTEKSSPYVIDGDVTVPDGQTLTIGQNVNVYFAGHYKFTVNGTLKAITDKDKKHHILPRVKYEEKPIHFTCDSAANPTGWAGIRFVNAGKNSRLSGCVIEFGRATGEGAEAMGGGVYCENSALTIENTIIRNNAAKDFGGGLAAVNSSISMANCAFSENSAGNAGGGIYTSGGSIDVANVAIDKNTGGGIYVSGTNMDLANAAVHENTKGGITLLNHSHANIANCAISGNHGAERGGGVYCSGSNLDIANGAISDNDNGGLFCEGSSDVSLANCAISGNRGGKNLDRDNATKLSAVNSAVKD